jgi:catechol 2,3-dioxygenase-like lactoylglutathione lyase family enzyme
VRSATVLTALCALGLAAPAFAQSTAVSPAAAPTGALLGTVIHVSDVPGSLRFYVDGLGMSVSTTLELTKVTETMLGFDADPAKPRLILLSSRTDRQPIEHAHGFDRVVMRMTDLDATAARLRTAGFAPSPIRNVAHGYRMMTVTDPDGYEYELVQRGPQQPGVLP